MRLLRILTLLLVALTGLTHNAAAQRIVSMNIDTTHCVGDSLRFSVGYGTWHNVVIESPPLAISHPQRTFLPDGTVCDSTLGTCTYRSPVTYDGFIPSAVVTSAQDIDFVRLNIEHSFPRDLLIAIECPTGQFALLSHASGGHVACGDGKFDLPLPQFDFPITENAFLGQPLDESANNNPCDTNDPKNQPGIGWNYCWSENTSHTYAPNNGIILNQANVINVSDGTSNYATIDSTHISANTNFYRPQSSFDSLIGCPLNGTWNIVVQDGWHMDNGWLFDWEMAFDTSTTHNLYPNIASATVSGGNGYVSHDDTSGAIVPQETDTVVVYALRVILTTGDTIDTTFSVHWLEPFVYSETDTLCQGDTARWTSLVFTADTIVHIRETASFGCDSIVDLSYTFMPNYYPHDTIPYCANEQFLYDGIDYGGPATIIVPHLTQYGCDSTVTVHLVTIDSAFHLQLQMSDDGVLWSADTVLHGCQPMTLWLRDTTLFEQWRRWDFGDGDTLRQQVDAFQQPQPFTHVYDSVGTYTLSLMAMSIHGCVDSVVFRADAVRVWPTPDAEFIWSPELIVMHDAWTQFENLSTPMDSLRFMWHIPNGEDGEDTTREVSPRYQWPVVYGEQQVSLEAIWTHTIDDSLMLDCIDTTTHNVVIINDYLQFPNLVTPNGDGVNDTWRIVNLLEYGLYSMNELWIFNSWGVLVHHVRNISREEDFWDPSGFPDGTYFYRFTARSPYGIVKRNGTIEVLR